jgi:hypothetical protein
MTPAILAAIARAINDRNGTFICRSHAGAPC